MATDVLSGSSMTVSLYDSEVRAREKAERLAMAGNIMASFAGSDCELSGSLVLAFLSRVVREKVQEGIRSTPLRGLQVDLSCPGRSQIAQKILKWSRSTLIKLLTKDSRVADRSLGASCLELYGYTFAVSRIASSARDRDYRLHPNKSPMADCSHSWHENTIMRRIGGEAIFCPMVLPVIVSQWMKECCSIEASAIERGHQLVCQQVIARSSGTQVGAMEASCPENASRTKGIARDSAGMGILGGQVKHVSRL
ncbi:hypothetical protein GOBAR_AA03400 [Gossypium barbadense]|uniref:Uncharacterized protein n=1 Tax=Gossypium barbadense TaxID=3634 RepID=A0A2P5YNJ4_GOSBA|nr:hypothetical protein GOBAR_AA03400 [Gossypium barbadense]